MWGESFLKVSGEMNSNMKSSNGNSLIPPVSPLLFFAIFLFSPEEYTKTKTMAKLHLKYDRIYSQRDLQDKIKFMKQKITKPMEKEREGKNDLEEYLKMYQKICVQIVQ